MRLDTWLGKLLRIDPRASGGQPYTVPADNPFVGQAGALPGDLVARAPQPVALLLRRRAPATSGSATSARTRPRRSTSPRRPQAAARASTSAGAPSRAPTATTTTSPPTARSDRCTPTTTATTWAGARSPAATCTGGRRSPGWRAPTSSPTTARAGSAPSPARASGDRGRADRRSRWHLQLRRGARRRALRPVLEGQRPAIAPPEPADQRSTRTASNVTRRARRCRPRTDGGGDGGLGSRTGVLARARSARTEPTHGGSASWMRARSPVGVDDGGRELLADAVAEDDRLHQVDGGPVHVGRLRLGPLHDLGQPVESVRGALAGRRRPRARRRGRARNGRPIAAAVRWHGRTARRSRCARGARPSKVA